VLVAVVPGARGSAAAQEAPVTPPFSAWEVPAGEREKPNPVQPTPEALGRGRMLYGKHCASCHGNGGKGDGPAANFWREMPKDLSNPDRQRSHSDGDIYWKITSGRRIGKDVIMPAFSREVPSAEDRWKIVLYVRTLNAEKH
jgi:mono/diheme cytochrome c family protein